MSFGRRALSILALLFVLFDLVWVFTKPLDEDEVEHLHAIYLVSQGERPYVDFWQSHPPLFWEMLAPAIRILPESAGIAYCARGFSVLVAALLFFVLWRWVCPRRGARGSWVVPLLLFATIAIPAQILFFRPDPTILLLALVSLGLTARALERPDVRARHWRFLGAGCATGLALAGSPKLLPLAGVAPAVLVWCWIEARWIESRRVERRRIEARSLLLYTAGGIAGFAVLVVYLFARGVQHGYWDWIVVYHGGRGMSLAFDAAWVPLLLVGAMSLVVTLALRAHATRALHEPRGRVLLVATALMLIGTIVLYPIALHVMAFYLAPLLVCVCAWGVFANPHHPRAHATEMDPRAHATEADPRAHATEMDPRAHATEMDPLARATEAGLRGSRRLHALVTSTSLALIVGAAVVPVTADFRTIAGGATLAKNLEFIQWMIDVSAHQRVLCHVPLHPIYAQDATDFWVRWQYHHLSGAPSRKQEMLRELIRQAPPIDEALAADPPTLINGPAFARHLRLLRDERLLTAQQFEAAHAFVEGHYNLVRGVLFVRKDVRPTSGAGR